MGEGVHVSPKDIRVRPVILPKAVVLDGASLQVTWHTVTFRVWNCLDADLWCSDRRWDVTHKVNHGSYVGNLTGNINGYPTLQQALDVRNSLR